MSFVPARPPVVRVQLAGAASSINLVVQPGTSWSAFEKRILQKLGIGSATVSSVAKIERENDPHEPGDLVAAEHGDHFVLYLSAEGGGGGGGAAESVFSPPDAPPKSRKARAKMKKADPKLSANNLRDLVLANQTDLQQQVAQMNAQCG
jgi:hypothetical protein